MNNDLISREALKKTLCKEYEAREHYIGEIMLQAIDNAPTVEILPENVIEAHTKIGYERGFNDGYAKCVEDNERPQGEWIEGSGIIACSNCHMIWLYRRTNFCPNCGAKMFKGDTK